MQNKQTAVQIYSQKYVKIISLNQIHNHVPQFEISQYSPEKINIIDIHVSWVKGFFFLQKNGIEKIKQMA